MHERPGRGSSTTINAALRESLAGSEAERSTLVKEVERLRGEVEDRDREASLGRERAKAEAVVLRQQMEALIARVGG